VTFLVSFLTKIRLAVEGATRSGLDEYEREREEDERDDERLITRAGDFECDMRRVPSSTTISIIYRINKMDG
jgi:hypothetical protein